MKLTYLLSTYIGRYFLYSFAAVFLTFLTVIFLFDVVELLRRATSQEGLEFGTVIKMGLLKLPFLGQQTFPFAVLFGSMFAFWRLTRSNELVVARAAGVSAWQIVFPVIFLAVALGIFKIAAFNPLASAMLSRFDRLEATYFKGRSSLIDISQSGLWLRQANEKSQSVIRAKSVSLRDEGVQLTDVTIFVFDGKDVFKSRIGADSGVLEDGFWHLRNVKIHVRDGPVTLLKEDWFATDLTLANIQDSFAAPETMSFWSLPGFIKNLDKAGFSAIRHRLYWHSLLAAPFLLVGMVLIAATFTLHQSRNSKTAVILVGGIFTSLLLYFFSDVVFALGLRDAIPVTLAAWTPAGVSILLGLAMVFHLEDG